MAELSDEELGQQFTSTNEAIAKIALGVLVVRYATTFRAQARRLVPPRCVDDLLQDHGLRLFASRLRFDPANAWLPWARRVLQNLATDMLRRLDEPESFAGDEGPPDERSSPDETAASEEEARLVRECIEELSPEDRTLLTLKQWEGLTFEEIGKRLGLTMATVSSRYYRALERLAEALRHRGLEE